MKILLLFIFSFILVQNLAWAEINNPQELSKFMKKNFKFVEDRTNFGVIDYWQSAEEMLSIGSGDCEDYAIFVQGVLNKLGYESIIISIYAKNYYGHTITVYKDNGKWNVFNDGKLYKYKADTLEKAVSKVKPDYTWYAITEKKNTRGNIISVFLK